MTMAHFSRNHRKPFIKGNNLTLSHQRSNGKRIGLARFAKDPSINLRNRNCGHDEIGCILNRLLETISVGATDEELNPSGGIDYGWHRSASL